MANMGGEAVDPLADGLVHFSPLDAAVIVAAAARLIPTDANGPGATEAGVVHFIDRQLAKVQAALHAMSKGLGEKAFCSGCS